MAPARAPTAGNPNRPLIFFLIASLTFVSSLGTTAPVSRSDHRIPEPSPHAVAT